MYLILASLGLSFLAISIYLIATSPGYRSTISHRVGLAKLQWNGDPTTTSSEKGTGFVSNTSRPEYADVFPPHRRATLAQLHPQALQGPGRSLAELSRLPPDYTKLTPDKSIADGDDLLKHTTATGFTVEEIKRLGDFPDYATLSGIPLPSPYTTFDIERAMARPYRPFRWPYHQTMCR